MSKHFGYALFLLLSFCLPVMYGQKLQVPGVFADNMVIQRGQKNPVWGKAVPNSVVKIETDKKIISVLSDYQGKWEALLPKFELNKKYRLCIINESDTLCYENIIAGDVYYAGGQSNMQFKLPKSRGGVEAVKLSVNDKIRFFNVPHAVAYVPRFDIDTTANETPIDAHWVSADSVNSVYFSAVAYYFARKVYQQIKIPVGIINVSWGGTPIEAHSSPNVNEQFPEFEIPLNQMKLKGSTEAIKIDNKKETPQLPSSIYNAMINPLISYGMKGVLWYQGEHNWNYPKRYEKQLTAFINDFRAKQKKAELPFFIVQLPNIGRPDSVFRDYYWAVLRESQQKAADKTNSNLCVTIDLGGDGNLHPANKLEVGERLAQLALRELYYKIVPKIYTKLKKYRIENGKIILTFDQSIKTHCSPAQFSGISICGSDGVFKRAEINIQAKKITVWNAEISKPIAVRYAWGANPVALLFDRNNMPVCPFRTDNFETRNDGTW